MARVWLEVFFVGVLAGCNSSVAPVLVGAAADAGVRVDARSGRTDTQAGEDAPDLFDQRASTNMSSSLDTPEDTPESLTPGECPTYVAALAESTYGLFIDDVSGCPEVSPSMTRGKTDKDCTDMPGGLGGFGNTCVLGNCVWCWSDDECQMRSIRVRPVGHFRGATTQSRPTGHRRCCCVARPES